MAYAVRVRDVGDDADRVVARLTDLIDVDEESIREALACGRPLGDGMDVREAAALGDAVAEIGVRVEVVPAEVPHAASAVTGTVEWHDGRAFADGVVRAVDMRAPAFPLAETRTDDRGRYDLSFGVPRSDAAAVELVVRPIEGDDVLAESGPIVGPGPDERVDVTIPARDRVHPTDGTDVFNFVSVRPPEPVDPDSTVQVTRTGTDFDGEIGRVLDDGDYEAAVDLADDFVSSSTYVSRFDDLELDLDAVEAAAHGSDHPEAFATAVEDAVGVDVADLVERDEFRDLHVRLRDSLVAATLAPESTGPPDRLVHGLRLLDLLERAAREDPSLGDDGALDAALTRSVVLPEELIPAFPERVGEATPEPSDTDADVEGDADADADSSVETLRRRLSRLDAAKTELARLRVSDLSPRTDATDDADPDEVDGDTVVRRLLTLSERDFLDTVETPGGLEGVTAEGEKTATVAVDERLAAGLDVRHLPSRTTELLSTETVALLEDLDVDFDAEPEMRAVFDRIEAAEREVGEKLFAVGATAAAGSRTMIRIGNAYHAAAEFSAMKPPAGKTPAVPTPKRHSPVRPLGFGDLRVLRQETQRYEPGEVAHIENVLAGELKERTHRRATTTEETFLTDIETTETTERDLQSTERYELESEATREIESRSQLEAGVNISAKYGPYVEVDSNFGYAQQNAKRESRRTATAYAREVMDRAVNRYEERIREQRTRRLLQEVEEENRHRIDNGNPDHVVGVYRWVDKIYNAQVFNYDKRLLLEFLVPEPAAFYLDALVNATPEGLDIEEPTPPRTPWGTTLYPHNLAGWNYLTYVQQYGVTGVTPPPPTVKYVTEPLLKEAEAKESLALHEAKKIPIDEGYMATEVSIHVPATAKVLVDGELTDWGLKIDVAGARRVLTHDSLVALLRERLVGGSLPPNISPGPLPLGNVIGELPVTVAALNVAGFSIGIHVKCVATELAEQKWQLETFEAIDEAYRELKRQYDDQRAAAAVEEGIGIVGNNPGENRAIERAELKKGAITMLGANRIDLDAIDEASAYGDIDLTTAYATGRAVKFFEHAFEWPQMTYVFYPYFWARRERWAALSQVRDNDPLFAEFLKAGMARVVVPVRPGYEEDILYFLQTGALYGGRGEPDIMDPRFVPIVEELKERQDVVGDVPDATPDGDPWQFKVPTSLVHLQAGSELPTLAPPIGDVDGDV